MERRTTGLPAIRIIRLPILILISLLILIGFGGHRPPLQGEKMAWGLQFGPITSTITITSRIPLHSTER
jgi:hypothetical protein